MRLLKKSKPVLITVVMCVSILLLFSLAAYASEGVKLSASNESGAVGSEVIVTISIEDGLETTGGQFDLAFDEEIVEPVSASRGGFLPHPDEDLFMTNLELAPGSLRAIWVTAAGSEMASGTVCTIVFEILKEGETDLTFSNIVVSPDDVDIADSVSGSIKGEDVDDLQAAINAANKAIAELPDPDQITLDDKEDVQKARELVEKAEDLGAESDDFDDLDKLKAAEDKIELLEAIKAADDAIKNLPSVKDLTLKDKPDVVAARALVNKAKDLGAKDADFSYLHDLRAAENRIRELEDKDPVTPPTGGISYLLPAGMLFLLFGLVAYIRRCRPASR